jgi:hypothetical protein
MDFKKIEITKFSVELKIEAFRKEFTVRLISFSGILIALVVTGARYGLHMLRAGYF